MDTTERIIKRFISLTDEQKTGVIKRLENNPDTPAELISGLRWLYEMSKTATQTAILAYISRELEQ